MNVRIPSKLISILSVLLLLLSTGCTEREHDSLSTGQPGKGLTFRIGLQGVHEAEWTRAYTGRQREAATQEKIAQLWFVIADNKGSILGPVRHQLAADFSLLTIEDLTPGRYTIAFLATTDSAEPTDVKEPDTIDAAWLLNTDAQTPLGKDYFHKKVEVEIDEYLTPVATQVVLERCVARVDVVVNMSNPYQERFIKDIRIQFDPNNTAYTSLHVLGEYSSPQPLTACNVTEERSFLSFPATGRLSGTVSVTSTQSNGTLFVKEYHFTECELTAGRVSRIELDYVHPESDNGLIYVGKETPEGAYENTMFLADEPQEVFYNESWRSFRVNRPLQVSISADHRLQVKLFSPIPVRNVTVLCRFRKYGTESFEFARFEELHPFQEATYTIPLVSTPQTYRALSGRHITIPAMPGLSDADVSFSIESDDPFLKKTAQIKGTWYIRFSPYSSDDGHPYWRHMTPELCRHGVALALNMAYMFSHPEFERELQNYEGVLKDNAGAPIDLEQLKNTIHTHPGLRLGHVTGVGGLGGGETYGLADYCYRDVYFDATPPDANPHNYARMAMFHEYGHCLGYNHDSNMTYGDAWTLLCANLFVSMGKRDMLPVSSRHIVGSLPMTF